MVLQEEIDQQDKTNSKPKLPCKLKFDIIPVGKGELLNKWH